MRVMEKREITTSVLLWLILVFHPLCTIHANTEGDALHAFRINLEDPNNVLQTWDPTLVNPCTWFHVTCSTDNSVIRVDLGNASLSGTLVSQLGLLRNLQYLELYSNNISGRIPSDLGNLTSLVSLDLYLNSLSGHIPDTLGKLSKLRFLRLNNNMLSGNIPMSMTNVPTLQVLDLSNNRLSGPVPDNGSFSLFTPISFANNLNLCGPVTGKPCPGSPPFSPPPPFVRPPPTPKPCPGSPPFSPPPFVPPPPTPGPGVNKCPRRVKSCLRVVCKPRVVCPLFVLSCPDGQYAYKPCCSCRQTCCPDI